jgi:hypothetical protein
MAALILAAVGLPVSPGTMAETTAMNSQLRADLDAVRGGRILFLHHSVGRNILEGLARIDAEAGGGKLRVATVDEAATLQGAVIIDAGGGRNTDPKSKMDAFAALLRAAGPRLRPDVAFMKLCYVDFNPSTDVDDVFAHYQRTLEALKREFPGVRFAHVTVPLTGYPTELRWRLRRLVGMEVWSDASNAKRAAYNAKLAAAFGGDPLFDLARVESTAPDGHRTLFEHAGARLPALDPRYSDDDGHLNALGQQVAGTAAIQFIADAMKARPASR